MIADLDLFMNSMTYNACASKCKNNDTNSHVYLNSSDCTLEMTHFK